MKKDTNKTFKPIIPLFHYSIVPITERSVAQFIFILLIFCLHFVYGCLPANRKIIGPEPVKPPPPKAPLSIERIDKKSALLNVLIEDKSRNRDERVLASDLLKDYQKIKSSLAENATGYDQSEIIEILFNNLSRFEETYLFNKESEVVNRLAAIQSLSEETGKIRETYLYGDYPGVTQACLELEKRFGPDALTPEIGLLLSLALAKVGKTMDALHVAQKIIGGLDEMPDATRLRTEMIEWQLQVGNHNQARQSYEKLFDDMDEKIARFKRAEKKIGLKRGDMSSLEDQPPELSLLSELNETHSKQLATVIKEADALVRNGQFQKAKLHLIRYRIRIQEGPEADVIDRILRHVEEAERQDQAGRQKMPSQENERIMAVRNLLDEEKYEEAITMIESQRKNQLLSEEMVALKQLAIEKLINRERNKAARLYLLAKNTRDVKKKKELLTTSYKILETLMNEFPSNPLNKKLNDHAGKVKEELIKLEMNPG